MCDGLRVGRNPVVHLGRQVDMLGGEACQHFLYFLQALLWSPVLYDDLNRLRLRSAKIQTVIPMAVLWDLLQVHAVNDKI